MWPQAAGESHPARNLARPPGPSPDAVQGAISPPRSGDAERRGGPAACLGLHWQGVAHGPHGFAPATGARRSEYPDLSQLCRYGGQGHHGREGVAECHRGMLHQGKSVSCRDVRVQWRTKPKQSGWRADPSSGASAPISADPSTPSHQEHPGIGGCAPARLGESTAGCSAHRGGPTCGT